MTADYSQLTEVPGSKATQAQLRRMRTRYRFAQERCRDKDVLEAACGAGMGLGLLAGCAKKVVAGDFTPTLLSQAQLHYQERIPLVRFDAQEMPFRSNSFDTVILYEAIYYLQRPESFVSECARVLRSGGEVIVCLPNKDLPDFHPSPHSCNYYTPPELSVLMGRFGFELDFYGNEYAESSTLRSRTISFLKTAAVRLNLIPGTLKGRELLKRLFFGRLTAVPAELDGGEYDVPVRLKDSCPGFRVIFAVARKLG